MNQAQNRALNALAAIKDGGPILIKQAAPIAVLADKVLKAENPTRVVISQDIDNQIATIFGAAGVASKQPYFGLEVEIIDGTEIIRAE